MDPSLIVGLAAGLGVLLVVIAFLSIFLPFIPGGAGWAYLGLLIWHIVTAGKMGGDERYSSFFIVTLGGIHLVAIVGDFLLPVLGGKVFKFSKAGIWGSLIGMMIGLFFFPPFGVILGSIVGTFIGELYHEFDLRKSLRITGYATLFTIAFLLAKIVIAGITAYYLTVSIWNYYL